MFILRHLCYVPLSSADRCFSISIFTELYDHYKLEIVRFTIFCFSYYERNRMGLPPTPIHPFNQGIMLAGKKEPTPQSAGLT